MGKMFLVSPAKAGRLLALVLIFLGLPVARDSHGSTTLKITNPSYCNREG